MNDQQFSKTLRRVLLGLMIAIGIVAAFFTYLSNPNTVFKNLTRQFEQAYQDSIAPMQQSDRALHIIEPAQLHLEQVFYTDYLNKLEQIDQQRLTTKNHADYQLLKRDINARLTFLDQLQRDPSLYNLGGKLKATLAAPEIALSERLQLIDQQLQEAKIYFEAAKKNLTNPESEKTRLSIEKQLLTLQLLQSELPDSIASANLASAEQTALLAKVNEAKLIVKDYLAFCQSLQFEHRDSTFSQPKPSLD